MRSILVPGLMLVIGKANWALPKALERVIPRLNVEGRGNDPAQGDDPAPTTASPGPSAEPAPAPAG